MRYLVIVVALVALSCSDDAVVGANRLLVSSDQTGNWEVLDVNIDSSIARPITKETGGSNKNPVWSPDGSHLAIASSRSDDYELFVLDLDGSVVHQLTDNHSTDDEPAWSPGGGQIAFRSDRTGDVEIFVMGSDGSGVRQLTDSPAEDWSPTWSPDGGSLAFASNRNGNWDIFVMRSDGTEVKQLTDSPDADLEPVWSPDGARLAFAINRDGFFEVLLIDVASRDTVKTGQVGIPSDWRHTGESEG